jgi:hypothetical protein
MILKIFLCAAAAVLAVAGNLGLIDEEKKGPVVLIHYIGLAVIFIFSYFHFDPKTALIVLMCDVAASYISYKIFSSR